MSDHKIISQLKNNLTYGILRIAFLALLFICTVEPSRVLATNGDTNYAKAHRFEENWHFDSAAYYYHRAQTVYRSQYDSVGLFKATTKLAVCEIFKLQLGEAAWQLSTIRRGYASFLDKRPALRLWFAHPMAYLKSMLDRYDEASILIRQSILKYEEFTGQKHPEYRGMIGLLAYDSIMLSNLDVTHTLIEEYLDLMNETYGPYNGGTLVCKMYLGFLHHYEGDFERAANLFHEAFAIKTKIEDADYYAPLMYRWYATHLMNVADKLSTDTQSNVLYREALAYAKMGYELSAERKAHYKMANCLTMLGRASSSLHGIDSAQDYFTQALASMHRAIPNPNHEHINILAEQGRTLIADGQFESAIKILDHGISFIKQMEQNPDYQPNMDFGSDYFYMRAQTLYELGRSEEALHEIQMALFIHNNNSMVLVGNHSLPDNSMLANSRESLEFLAMKIKILNDLCTSDNSLRDAMLKNGEIFDNLFNNVHCKFQFRDSKQSLQEVVLSTYNILIENLLLSRAEEDILNALRYSEKTRAIRLVTKINNRTNSQEYSKDFYYKLYSAENFKAHLESVRDGDLLEYYVGQENIYGFHLKQGEISVVQLGSTSFLEEQVAQYLGLLRDFPQQLTISKEQFEQQNKCLNQLSHLIYLKLVLPFMTEEECLTIVPHDFLSVLPFEALTTSEPGKLPMIYLVNLKAISYAPSILLKVDDNFSVSTNYVISGGAKELEYAEREKVWLLENRAFKSLRFDQLFDGNIQSSTRPNFHVSAHAGFDSEDLPIIQVEAKNGRTDTIRAEDLHNWRANFIFLAACESSIGTYDQGEGLRSMTYSCLSGGTKAVVGSLWPVRDASSLKICKSFYSSGISDVRTRLTNAKRKYLVTAKGYERHPYYWAPFITVGNTTLDFQKFNAEAGSSLFSEQFMFRSPWVSLIILLSLFLVAFLNLKKSP